MGSKKKLYSNLIFCLQIIYSRDVLDSFIPYLRLLYEILQHKNSNVAQSSDIMTKSQNFENISQFFAISKGQKVSKANSLIFIPPKIELFLSFFCHGLGQRIFVRFLEHMTIIQFAFEFF